MLPNPNAQTLTQNLGRMQPDVYPRYAPLLVDKQPGSKFSYSGGGFVVLQHLLEEIEKRDIGKV
jgi:CubicO group peptidase (beta-lactamase class C family)